jgi:hypothetical protein
MPPPKAISSPANFGSKISQNRGKSLFSGEGNRPNLGEAIRFSSAHTLLPNQNLEALASSEQFAAKRAQEPCATHGCL